MFLGTLQFWLSGNLFGDIGKKPTKVHEIEDIQDADNSIARNK